MKFHLILFLFLALFFSCSEGAQNKQSASSQETPSSPPAIVNGEVTIDYRSYGEGAYTVLFVHGWCIDQTYWAPQVEALREQYRVVTVDLPGFGDSGKNRSDWSIENYGADINAVIEQLGLEQVILVGHSMGGDVVLEAAVHNDKVIALIGVDNFKDVGAEMNEEVQAEIDGFMEMLKNNFTAVAAAYSEGTLFHPSTDSLVRQRVINDIVSSDSLIAIATLEKLFDYSEKEAGQLSSLKQKLYLINSDATSTSTAGLDATQVAYEVIDIPATGHYPMIEKPTQFNALLSQTLQTIVQTSRKN